jgi:KaiC/GvpD/RAD55 family RecA-like ATPase
METKLLRSLLRADFYTQNQSNVGAQLFEDELRDIYTAIAEGHDKYDQDLSIDDVNAIWLKNNPVATRAEKDAIEDFLHDISDQDPLADGVAQDYLKELWKRHIGHKIANLGVELTEGVPDAMARLTSLLDKTRDGILPDDFGDPVTDDIEELLAQFSDDARWKFNIETLSRHVYGIGPAEFGVVFALPETGKSAFAVSVCCGPGGFCEQGAKVLYLGNEEKAEKTKLRAMSCWSGMDKDQMHADPKRCVTQWMAIRDRMVMQNTQEWTLDKIEAYANQVKPDVIVIDQADKVEIRGSFSASHERLRELYRSFREMAKRLDCALLVVSQASNDARGRTRLSPFDMEGSKIGKAAETDLIIGIGKHEAGDVDDTEPDTTRYLTVSKNKLSGWHGTVICNIQPRITRYVE